MVPFTYSIAAMFAALLTIVQEVAADSIATGASGSSPTVFGDFWSLVEQAGPLRWPIFAVFALGLVLVIGKMYELIADRRVSRALMKQDFRTGSLTAISQIVAAQPESMAASLQSAMLNVFHTRPIEGMLHDEISNFVTSQQDLFGVFRRRMDFLADAAGALGLMGTVWGMFEVFFQGTSDKDVILRGMGIALITTLLGLVVSIILNLCATELSTFFERQLEKVSKKSDELRFRLLEIGSAVSEVAVVADPGTRAVHVGAAEPRVQGGARAKDDGPRYRLEPEENCVTLKAGEERVGFRVGVVASSGRAASGVRVSLIPESGGGLINGADGPQELVSEEDGYVRFDWTAPERAGKSRVDLFAPGATLPVRVELCVIAGKPERYEQTGNNQAAVAGTRLAHPLGVQVLDRFENPVPGVQMLFRVERGGGRLGTTGSSASLETGNDGLAQIPFAVSDRAGANVVRVSVNGEANALEFVAFGTEA